MDFTLTTYKALLKSLQSAGYQFLTFENVQGSQDESFGFGVSGSDPSVLRTDPLGGEQMKHNQRREVRNEKPETRNQKQETGNDKQSKTIILRHDVDLKAENSLKTAIIENELGVEASYYFRVVKQSNKPEIIKQIRDLGHEIGYHYEDLSLYKGNFEEAIKSFEKNLNHFRQFYPVKTICMHGSPLSKYDNRKLWVKYSYRDFGIIGEPYFDIDFSQVLYLTDTGRRWDGEKVSVRDKVQGSKFKVQGLEKKSFGFGVSGSDPSVLRTAPLQGEQMKHNQRRETRNEKPVTRNQKPETRNIFKSTFDIIRAAENNLLPGQIMITTHPQRWTNNPLNWTKEFVLQNVKNIVKMALVKRKNSIR